MTLRDSIQTIIAVGVLIGMVMGGITYFAKAADLKLVEVRLEQKIMSDQILQIKQQMWQLEDRNKSSDCTKWKNERDKQEYRNLKENLDLLQKKQNILIQQEKK